MSRVQGGRAEAGVFSATNPDCARECVKSGKKVVLIDPELHRIFSIDNQAAAMSNVGNYVLIVGPVNDEKQSVHIESIKLLQVGTAFCERRK